MVAHDYLSQISSGTDMIAFMANEAADTKDVSQQISANK